jgi:hypothetical protein
MKRLSFILVVAVLLLATKTLAGTLSVNGSLRTSHGRTPVQNNFWKAIANGLRFG